MDASAAVGLLVGEGDSAGLWSSWAEEGAVLLAPPHFSAEVANALLRSVGLPAADVAGSLGRLERSGVDIADRRLAGLVDAVSIADQHRLSVYDALYLQLAIEVEGELATHDQELRRAAVAEDVVVIG